MQWRQHFGSPHWLDTVVAAVWHVNPFVMWQACLALPCICQGHNHQMHQGMLDTTGQVTVKLLLLARQRRYGNMCGLSFEHALLKAMFSCLLRPTPPFLDKSLPTCNAADRSHWVMPLHQAHINSSVQYFLFERTVDVETLLK